MRTSRIIHGTRAIRWLCLPALTIVALVPGSGALNAQEGGAAEGEVTFAEDVAPILQESCQTCHRPGTVAPFSLLTYEDARRVASRMKTMVATRNMPPYHYDTRIGIQELKHDKRLSDEQIETVVRWVDSGMAMGDPNELPPPVEWPDQNVWQKSAELGREPDVVIASVPYTMPARGGNVWWNSTVDTGITEDRCIMAVEVKPTAESMHSVHHAIPSFQIQGDDGEWRGGGTLTEYAVGKDGEYLPPDACRLAPANSRLRWGNHYTTTGAETDVTVEAAIWFYPEGSEPEYEQDLSLYALERQGSGPVLDIAPHSRAMTQGFFAWDHPVRIDSFMAHGHYLLRAKWMEIFYPETGDREIVSMISNYDPAWQQSYTYEDDVAPILPAGAVLILTAVHDNTEDNPHAPDPDQWVNRGSRAVDEMSQAWIAVTHLDQERYEEIKAEREGRLISQAPDDE